MNSRKHVLERAICDLYSLEINAEQVFLVHQHSGMKITENSLPTAKERPQRNAAQLGRFKITVSYNTNVA